MSAPPMIFVGDLLRAVARLGPDAATTVEIGRLLGIDVRTARRARPALPPPGEPAGPPAATAPEAAGSREPQRIPGPLPSPTPAVTQARPEKTPTVALRAVAPGEDPPPGPARLVVGPHLREALRLHGGSTPMTRLGSRAHPAAEPWPDAMAALPAPDGEIAAETLPDPLFGTGRERAILTAMLGTETPGDELDLPALIDAVARGRTVQDLRRPRRTLRAGSEVLIDTGEALLPFALDAVVLRRQIRAVAGANVTFRRFAGCPTGSAGTGTGPRPWPAYLPPSRPTCVLVVSDLGAARTAGAHASVREWLDFARLVKDHGCRLRALVPYPLDRIPAALRGAIDVVSWQENTSVRSAVLRTGRS